jgi:peptidoglycan LD-endopeptidase LytH
MKMKLTELLASNVQVFPLLGNYLAGEPYVFDFSSKNSKSLKYDTLNFNIFQNQIFEEILENNASWGIGKYLEERKNILRNYPQMIREKRFYHLGLDIIVPAGVRLFAPLDSKVFFCGVESGVGNYGGNVILEHRMGDNYFYSLYGHLKPNPSLFIGQNLFAGDFFSEIGEKEYSGGWFTHVHVQILTPLVVKKGMTNLGYIAKENLNSVSDYFPDPIPLFRF